MKNRRRARGPPGLTQEGNFDRAQRRSLAAGLQGPIKLLQMIPVADLFRTSPTLLVDQAGKLIQQGGSGGPAAPSEQVHPPSPQQRHQSEAAAWRANRRDMLEDMLRPRQNLESLTAAIYGDLLQQHHADSQYLSERAILTLQNRDVDAINDMILQFFPVDATQLLVAHSLEEGPENANMTGGQAISQDVLNYVAPSGMLPHQLSLKEARVVDVVDLRADDALGQK
ncbi:MAG: hypothetical protein FRX49_03306 [Trebouxia sp. A1-2]|nr:MAG: hypothetical protein FRX49_03306 [Trebouxia sp. A1-2]